MTTIERNDQILAMLVERERLLDQRERALTEELRSVTDDLRRARAAIAALDPNVGASAVGRGATPGKSPRLGAVGDVPFTETVVAVLRKAGKAMEVRDIMDALQARGIHPDWDYKRFRDTFNGTVGRKARAKKTFYVAAKGAYALLEWKQRGKSAQAGDVVAPSIMTNGVPNTEIVIQYVQHYPGYKRAQLIKAVEGKMQTGGDQHRAASTTISNLIRKGKLIEDADTGIRVAGSQQLSLVAPGGGAAA